jgi:oxygen-independent coproporphyrinogen-3 oxidase
MTRARRRAMVCRRQMTDLVEKYGSARVPRYTSYPTAPNFHHGIGAAAVRGWLAALAGDTRLSLYLHVPFCDRLCWFCGCHTTITQRSERMHAYAGLLAREIDLVAAALPGRVAVSHMHWGGGTPTILSAADFASLMAALGERFAVAPDAEVAVEIDPRTLDAAMAETLAAEGVTRASLGVQDFTPAVQRAVNRVQPFELVARVVGLLRGEGIGALNFDLMYGLPHQTVADVERSVDLAASLEPDRVAVFGYAHVPWMKKHQRMIEESALPSPAERKAQTEAASARLVAHGYRRIGMDHFARRDDAIVVALEAGRLHRNFQGYTTDDASALVGFGASAISALPQGYAQNTGDLKAYRESIAAGELAIVRGIALSADDRFRRAVIEHVMCDFAVDLDRVRADHGVTGAPEADRATLAEMARDGLIDYDGRRLRVTEAGRPFVRSVAACFDRYLSLSAGRHAQAV